MSMQVFVEAFTGTIVTLDVESSDSIEAVKQKLQDQLGVPPTYQDVLFEGTLLEDGMTLADYNVQANATLQLELMSGVVDYELVDETAPSDGGTQLAHLRGGAVMGQRLEGVIGGATYALDFWAQGSLRWGVQFLDASDQPLDLASGVVTGDPPGLTAFSVAVAAPPAARAAQLTLQAADLGPSVAAAITGPAAVLFDLVSLTQTFSTAEPPSSVDPAPAEPATPIQASPDFTG